MGVGAFVEPLVVVTLLFGGAWVNRNTSVRFSLKAPSSRRNSSDNLESGLRSPNSEDGLLEDPQNRPISPSLLPSQESRYRTRKLRLFSWQKEVTSPNTRLHKNTFLSRVLQKLPFLVEVWYWALIYWVYQVGRAITALTLVEGTVDVARKHALQIIHLEKKLHIFWELPVQHWFLKHPLLMIWTNRIYSFIHIPGTILFLVFLFYYTTTSNRIDSRREHRDGNRINGSPAGPLLYEARRRTMAVCNLIAFIVFTLWPCMPPRLLSDKDVKGPIGKEARSYGFVDTVHGEGGESSVWTQNKFCNQYAAMPSLHFGYSLLIGLTVMTIPLAPQHQQSRHFNFSVRSYPLSTSVPSVRRVLCVLVGLAYPLTILLAIVATANHFVLDAVAGAMVCGIAWYSNGILLNLVPLEDYFLSLLRIHKPENVPVTAVDGLDDEDDYAVGKGVVER
ncbi:integral membrane protein [Pseudovirgaria hyperparasitica]|uniref:Integral membrane protein n=1 Tax=Pseudovirgaria hyperparasitica TaxID=470096 RepID=A0A6A6WKR4_9PEZI|nr:uncharacterized protein EJ05DRAFT_14014 [Pseudovirgaria hyperparasitica]KAF2762767.1 integral membrane protein [Pseudovirgaria hyperparasitica]